MAGPFFSASWHFVADLRPRLQLHAQISRHRARGEAYYVIRNAANGQTYRVSPPTYQFLCELDGRTSVQAAWRRCAEALDERAPAQDDVIALLGQLHEADLLQSDVAPDPVELRQRRSKHIRRTLMQHVGNPMSLRLPLWNPERFLSRTLPFVRPFTGLFGLLLWCTAVLPALVLAGMHKDQLLDGGIDNLLSLENAMLIACVFPVVKLLHELGHAYAVRARGGMVAELGVMFLVLLPIPYVDASASSMFRNRWHRAAVGGAGMLVETFVAAIALYVWLLVEPGAVRAVAFTTMLIAGFSTVLFNGNPLLRYDGYFILVDLIGIPNLGQRAGKYWGWLADHYLYGAPTPRPPTAPGERAWFIAYAPASFVARLSVTVGIALLIATKFFAIGVILAAWAVFMSALLPVLRALKHVCTAPSLARHRLRAVSVTAGGAALFAAAATLFPMPLHSVAEGVVWLPDEATVRTDVEGFVTELHARAGTVVAPGDVLAITADPSLAARVDAARARVRAVQARLASEEWTDQVKAAISRKELAIEQSTLRRALERQAALVIRAKVAGRFTVPRPEDLPNRYLKRGEILGYVLPDHANIMRVVVAQADVDLVRTRLRSVAVLGAADLGAPVPASVVREVPGGSDELPSRALATEGGGQQAIDPRDQQRPKTLNRLFQFDLAVPIESAGAISGGHVWVRFDHGTEPAAEQAYRRLRQLLLSHFNA